jgi:hypothetical protein
MVTYFLIMFVQTLLLSRLALWLMRRWDRGWVRLLCGHFASLALSWAWFAIGGASGKTYLAKGAVYTGPEAVWLLIDLLRGKSAREG